MIQVNEIYVYASIFSLFLSVLLGLTIWLLAKNVISKFKLESEINDRIQHAIISSEEAEREIIANNLHDDFGPQVSILIRQLKRGMSPNSPMTLTPEEREAIYSKLDGFMADLRKYSTEIYPTQIQHLGLIRSLEQNLFDIQSQIKTNFFDKTDRELNFDLPKELTIYRIINEVLNNILKHASATEIECEVSTIDSFFEINFTHNGIPFNQEDFLKQAESGKGKGCSSILNRTLQLNGTIEFFHILDLHSCVRILIPMK